MDEKLIGYIITASVTGAGLVLTAYSFVTNLFTSLEKNRSRIIKKMFQQIKKEKNTDKIKKLIEEVDLEKNTQEIYLSWSLVGLTFILFLLAAITSTISFFDNVEYKIALKYISLWLFIIANVFFLILGMTIIDDLLKYNRNKLK